MDELQRAILRAQCSKLSPPHPTKMVILVRPMEHQQVEIKQPQQLAKAMLEKQIEQAAVERLAEKQRKRDMAHKILEAETGINILKIKTAVRLYFGCTEEALTGQSREGIALRPRQIAMYLARKLTRKTLPEIGRKFGNRDHTTVLHAVRKFENMICVDEQARSDIELIKHMILHSSSLAAPSPDIDPPILPFGKSYREHAGSSC